MTLTSKAGAFQSCRRSTAPPSPDARTFGRRQVLNSGGIDDNPLTIPFAVYIRAANSRGPGGPVRPLGTPFRTPGTLSGLTKMQ